MSVFIFKTGPLRLTVIQAKLMIYSNDCQDDFWQIINGKDSGDLHDFWQVHLARSS